MCTTHVKYQKCQILSPQLYVSVVIRLFIQNVNLERQIDPTYLTLHVLMLYVIVRVKTSLVHTSNSITVIAHKNC